MLASLQARKAFGEKMRPHEIKMVSPSVPKPNRQTYIIGGGYIL